MHVVSPTFILFREFDSFFDCFEQRRPVGTRSLDKGPLPTWRTRTQVLSVCDQIRLHLILDNCK